MLAKSPEKLGIFPAFVRSKQKTISNGPFDDKTVIWALVQVVPALVLKINCHVLGSFQFHFRVKKLKAKTINGVDDRRALDGVNKW